MGDDMVTMFRHLSLFEVSHMIFWMPYDDEFQLLTYELIWASMFHSIGGEILRDLDFILPMEGKMIIAQVHLSLHSYHVWIRGQCGVGYGAYDV